MKWKYMHNGLHITRSSAVAEKSHDALMLRVIEYFIKSLKIIQIGNI